MHISLELLKASPRRLHLGSKRYFPNESEREANFKEIFIWLLINRIVQQSGSIFSKTMNFVS